MMKMNTDIERICAVLHDVVEDSSITFKELKDEGFSEEVIEVLTHLTKKKGKIIACSLTEFRKIISLVG